MSAYIKLKITVNGVSIFGRVKDLVSINNDPYRNGHVLTAEVALQSQPSQLIPLATLDLEMYIDKQKKDGFTFLARNIDIRKGEFTHLVTAEIGALDLTKYLGRPHELS